MAVAIIGGSGFSEIDSFKTLKQHNIETPYGEISAPVIEGSGFNANNVYFLARHGLAHSILPHKINYRANIFALKELGVKNIIALAAVGGIDDNCTPGSIIVPEQILDYSHSREATFFDDIGNVAHAEFTEPYTKELRDLFLAAANTESIKVVDQGTYAVTQGPRFETAAEIKRYKRDGASIVGMTAMPEAVLARELGMGYITVALSVNYAAGIQKGVIEHGSIHESYSIAANKLYSILPNCLDAMAKVDATIPELIRP